MDGDPSHGQSLNKKAQDLQKLTTGSLSSSISKLSSSSRALQTEKDFHFYYIFDEFKNPINEIKSNSTSMLEAIGSSSHVWSNKQPTAFPGDLDDAYDWLVNINDEVFERLDASVDEFKNVRKVEEETGRRAATSSVMVDDGFQLVNGRKKKGMNLEKVEKVEGHNFSSFDVKVASRDKKAMGEKPRVPFHVPSIPRPQTKFNILVNNSNQPFEHVWLQRSEDGSRLVHPLENLSVLDFVDKDVDHVESVKPLTVECSTFKLVEEVKDLKELAAKLRSVNEFAVDLEHNQYRSFQGLTCLMQISTRTEDFIVDTLKLRIHIGPYLREVFKDPTKKKVMHGADRDIVWLQRDFGIYVCNLFDTGQVKVVSDDMSLLWNGYLSPVGFPLRDGQLMTMASRVLNLERNSLEYLLNHFCGVTANKEYQNADWRIRPLPDVMTRYAREDTHYLLHIYDLMKIRLCAMSIEGEDADALIEVYKRSYDVCMQLYEKELLTDSSYLHIYGLQTIDFSAQQLAIAAALCEWRDVIARAEDESTGYILPNKTLLLVAKHMPETASKLRRLLRSKHPYIEQNSATVSHVIKQAIQNAAAFEPIAAQLTEGRLAMASQEAVEAGEPEFLTEEPSFDEHLSENGRVLSEVNHFIPEISREPISTPSQITGATVQVLKKPSRAFGALLGSSASKRKFDTDKYEKEKMKLEQIKSSVNLPFHSFPGNDKQLKPHVQNQTEASAPRHPDDQPTVSPTVSNASSDVEEVIMLDNDSDVEDCKNVVSKPSNDKTEHKEAESVQKLSENSDGDDEPMSLSELSSNFRKCFQSNNHNQTSNGKTAQKLQEPAEPIKIKPFDYGAALRFTDAPEKQPAKEGNEKKNLLGRKKSGHAIKKEESGDFQLGKRRQAFPASGNRSATFS